MSVAMPPVVVPNCSPLRTTWATRALQTSFLLGMHAILGQEPPTYRRSTTADTPACPRHMPRKQLAALPAAKDKRVHAF